ncbi:ABC transporter permease subunit [Arthrobacter zhangbolii]|uniref:ABC transporter permease subunit n=1 Tax=Arthrobacter zhangbolii TaxID=2886936 RepID=A0A9X1SAD8_9MICC|nr:MULTISPECIES: ABC transporter permease subunit [Arthrobacter]MCC3273431.1 ABC transporter permease subunit [Arthrobacter zhangbolii]MCC3296036.1 ABC transporter permease subunit [Arthrobacter zhangbolii]MDN3905712.1 ABC transporter permease subunit [Arthrobacter sp. YD2]UON92595.1 ABC transporter permease subunit [Arthrobacter zhangbolii]
MTNLQTLRKSPARPAEPAPAKRASAGAWLKEKGWRHLVGLVIGAFALLPLVYVLSAALSPTGTLVSTNGLFSTVSLDNFSALFSDPQKPFAKWFLNTLVIGLVTSIGTVFLGALAAYSFSRMRFRGRRMGLLSLMLLQMFPQMLGVVAIFLLLSGISDVVPWLGLGSQIGLIMVYLGGALGVNTYLMYGFFNTVPVSLDEAARIDGASHIQIFFTIILRLVTPILAIVGLLSFITATGEFLIASIVLNDPDTQTLAVGLYSFVGDNQSRTWGVFSAGAVLAALPVMALFLFLQRYITSGLIAGSVKG